MASTFSAELRLEKPADGELTGTWGQRVNAGITEMVEEAVAGMTVLAFTASDITLTTNNGATDQARNAILQCTGTLTASVNAIVPNNTKIYVIDNQCTLGGFTVSVKTSGGSAVEVAAGPHLYYVDGSDVITEVTDVPSSGGMDLTTNQDVSSNKEWQDNDKVIFGAGADMSIFHNGTNTIIDVLTGTLRIEFETGSELMAEFNPNNAVDLYFNNVKKFETTSAGITVTGDGSATDWIQTSDERLKEKIKPFEYKWDPVMEIVPQTFRFKEGDTRERIGFIAQDIRPHIPEAVSVGDDEMLHLSNTALIAVLWAKVREQNEDIQSHETRIADLESRLGV